MNSRNKGAKGERELAEKLRGMGFKTRRGQQYSGANGDADVVGIEGLHIECKRVERLDLDGAMERARRGFRRVTIGMLDGAEGWIGVNGWPMVVKPVAWAPLPEPWEEDWDEKA